MKNELMESKGSSNMTGTHPDRQGGIKRTEKGGSQNSSYSPVLLNDFFCVYGVFLNL